jgi:hypothetical protein
MIINILNDVIFAGHQTFGNLHIQKLPPELSKLDILISFGGC